jgi:hypothetical protein
MAGAVLPHVGAMSGNTQAAVVGAFAAVGHHDQALFRAVSDEVGFFAGWGIGHVSKCVP